MAKTVKLQATVDGKYVSIGLVGENSMMMPIGDSEMIGETIVAMVRKAQEAGKVSSEEEQRPRDEPRARIDDDERDRRRDGYGDVSGGDDDFYSDPITQTIAGGLLSVLGALSSHDHGRNGK